MNDHFESVDLKKILDIIVAFNSERDFMNLLDIILTKMRGIANCEAGTLYVVRDDKLHFAIMHNEKLDVYLREEAITLPPISLDKTSIENVSAYCAINNSVVNIADVYDSTEFNFQGPRNYDKITGFRTKSMMVFPLLDLHGHVIGVIQLINARDESDVIIPFDERMKFVFRSIANIAASTLANLQNIAEIKGLFYSFVSVISQAIDERSPYNVNHAKQTAEYAKEFVHFLRDRFPQDSELYFDDNREEQLILAILMHDIGKVVTPIDIMGKESRIASRLPIIRQRFDIRKLQDKVDCLSGRISESELSERTQSLDESLAFVDKINNATILFDEDAETVRKLADITYVDADGNTSPIFEEYDMECLLIKRGTLTDSEREVMQDHVAVGGRLLDNIKFNRQYENVPDWVKKHHEFLDGTGYPNRIKEDSIPPEARIITILDIFDALTASDRPYRGALPYEKSIGILSSMADEGKLDKGLVDLFAESGVKK